jgi:phosphoribosylformimino-5-aminoimidazole carboxamide ribotide isomerase
MLIIPAIDLKAGKCVRLLQGRKEDETVFSSDPASVARRWASQGAELLHVVDLDGAFEKRPRNMDSVQKIVAAVPIPVQVGGGIRDAETIARYLDIGVSRVILGTEAIRNPQLVETACRDFPGRIVVGIDARNGMVAIEGWVETTGTSAVALARRFEDCGVAAINFTDIQRDGMQSGPNLVETRKLAESILIPVVASGGVAGIEDIRNLLALESFGVTGIITGKALYTGGLDLAQAIALTKAIARKKT